MITPSCRSRGKIIVVAEILAGIVENAGGSCGSQAWMLSVVCRILAVGFINTFLGISSLLLDT